MTSTPASKNEADVARVPPTRHRWPSGATLTLTARRRRAEPAQLPRRVDAEQQGADDERLVVTSRRHELGDHTSRRDWLRFDGYSTRVRAESRALPGPDRSGSTPEHGPGPFFQPVAGAAANHPLVGDAGGRGGATRRCCRDPEPLHDCGTAHRPTVTPGCGVTSPRLRAVGAATTAAWDVTRDDSESNRDRDDHIATIAVGQRVPGGLRSPAHRRHYGLCEPWKGLDGLPSLGPASGGQGGGRAVAAPTLTGNGPRSDVLNPESAAVRTSPAVSSGLQADPSEADAGSAVVDAEGRQRQAALPRIRTLDDLRRGQGRGC